MLSLSVLLLLSLLDPNQLTKVRLVGTVRDMIDNIPMSYSKMTLRCGQRNIVTRVYHIIRDENLKPLHVLFDDSCLPPPNVRFAMDLSLNVYFNEWETDEGILLLSLILINPFISFIITSYVSITRLVFCR